MSVWARSVVPGSLRRCGAVLVLAVALVGCGLPVDPEASLAEARATSLEVGVVHDPPWVVVEDGRVVGGVEVEVVRRFAETLGTEVTFLPGSLHDLGPTVGDFELDLLIGGFTADSPWLGPLAVTPTYFTERVIAAGGVDDMGRDGLRGRTVLYPRDEPSLASRIRSEDGVPQPVHEVQDAPLVRNGLVALPQWRAEQLGLRSEGVTLQERRHVMALPPGENALLLGLATFLDDQEQRVLWLLRAEP
jgi:hypothetical protein